MIVIQGATVNLHDDTALRDAGMTGICTTYGSSAPHS